MPNRLQDAWPHWSAVGIESAHVLGASFGGAVAQHIAICHPGRVRRPVLASTSFGTFAIPGHPTALWHIIHPGSHRGRMCVAPIITSFLRSGQPGRQRALWPRDPSLVRPY